MPLNDKGNISLGLGTLELGTYDNNHIEYKDGGLIKTCANFEANSEGYFLTIQFAELTPEMLCTILGGKPLQQNSDEHLPKNAFSDLQFLDRSVSAPFGTLCPGKKDMESPQGVVLLTAERPILALRFTHVKVNGKRQVFEFERAQQYGQITIPFNEDDWNLYTVTFKGENLRFIVEKNPLTPDRPNPYNETCPLCGAKCDPERTQVFNFEGGRPLISILQYVRYCALKSKPKWDWYTWIRKVFHR